MAGYLAAPGALFEGAERGLAGFGVDRSVDVLQRRRDRLSVFPGDKIEAVAQQVDDAGLYCGLREDGHLVAWIRQESSRIRHLWRLTDSEVSSLFSGLAYPCNKVPPLSYQRAV